MKQEFTPKTVLLLDDEEHNLTSFQATFKRHYKVLTASTVEEARQIFETEFINVFVSDEKMPSGSGLEFIQEVKSSYPDTVCMLMTAYDDTELVRNAINKGHVFYYVTKPWDEEGLSLILEKAFEKCFSSLELKEKNRALEKANYELDKLVYAASHDLRTPLSGILGLARLLKREIAGNDEANRYTDLIEESTNRMIDVLDTMGEYSMLRTKDTSINSIDLRDTINGIVARCKKRYATPEIEWQVSLSFEGEMLVHLSEKKVKLLLKKLIENAFQFVRPGELVHHIRIAVIRSEQSLNITIEDSGEGILPNTLNDIFTLFYRGSNQSKGVGMGLYLAKELVQVMHGTLNVNSEPGKGSKFIVELPTHQY